MNGLFWTYLELGFRHILDPNGYDHMLFILALCALYSLKEWKVVLFLVTAFTIGHSMTLAVAAFGHANWPAKLIEFLIPLTILFTALFNIIRLYFPSFFSVNSLLLNYFTAAFFGLIHGLGFSIFFRASSLPGEESQFLLQLISFNLGVELGQLIFVVGVLIIAEFFLKVVRLPRNTWAAFISVLAVIASLSMMWERYFW